MNFLLIHVPDALRGCCHVATSAFLDAPIQALEEALLQLFAEAGPGTSRAMAKRRQAAHVRHNQTFKRRQFTAEVVLIGSAASSGMVLIRYEEDRTGSAFTGTGLLPVRQLNERHERRVVAATLR